MAPINIIFHIPHTINNSPASGSDLRPLRIMSNFQKFGNVIVISGGIMERKRKINHVKDFIKKGNKIDFVYSESSTMPTALTESHHFPLKPLLDFRFFKFCKKNKIPIALFYRDIHWRFEHHRRKVKLWKRIISYPFYYLDLFFYNKYVDILFVPSIEMVNHIPISLHMTVKALPPGCNSSFPELINRKPKNKKNINLSYIGGLGDLYQIQLLVRTIASLNMHFKLLLNTRFQDWEEIRKSYQNIINDRIIISHYHSKDIDKIYNITDIACIFIKPILYWSFVMPLKLFEAIYFLKPVLATEGTAVGNFVIQNDIGWVVKYEEKELHRFLINLSEYEIESKKKSLEIVRYDNTWERRCLTVINEINSISFKVQA